MKLEWAWNTGLHTFNVDSRNNIQTCALLLCPTPALGAYPV